MPRCRRWTACGPPADPTARRDAPATTTATQARLCERLPEARQQFLLELELADRCPPRSTRCIMMTSSSMRAPAPTPQRRPSLLPAQAQVRPSWLVEAAAPVLVVAPRRPLPYAPAAAAALVTAASAAGAASLPRKRMAKPSGASLCGPTGSLLPAHSPSHRPPSMPAQISGSLAVRHRLPDRARVVVASQAAHRVLAPEAVLLLAAAAAEAVPQQHLTCRHSRSAVAAAARSRHRWPRRLLQPHRGCHRALSAASLSPRMRVGEWQSRWLGCWHRQRRRRSSTPRPLPPELPLEQLTFAPRHLPVAMRPQFLLTCPLESRYCLCRLRLTLQEAAPPALAAA